MTKPRLLLSGLVVCALMLGGAAAAQKRDDAYRPPAGQPGSTLGGQAGISAPPPAAGQGRPASNQAPARRGDGPIEIDVNQGVVRPIPIAVHEFAADDPKLGLDVSNIVAANLERSGLFKLVDRSAFLERLTDTNVQPNMNNWRPTGAEYLVVGRVARVGEGRLQVEFRLWDVLSGQQRAGQRFAIRDREWRRLAHLVADQTYERVTGEKGYFDTQVVFVDETGAKDKRLKRLAIMDQDGANVRLLSQGRELVLTPRFSPTSQDITFLQYQGEQPRVFLMNLESGQRQLLGDFPGMTFAPRFSPDGQRVVMSIQEQGSPASNLVEMDLRSRQMRRLTQTSAIDTAPSYSPDGRRIVFESDREGGQQLYVMGADGSGARRISFGDGRYSTPVWSPRGDLIAFTKQSGGRFLIGVMAPDGSGERILTDGYHNEGPTWSPNGRVLMFFRESQGANGGPKLFSIDLTGYNERQVPTPSFGSDPAWSPLRG
jgi:TolB protein